jgi:hypothetical protein
MTSENTMSYRNALAVLTLASAFAGSPAAAVAQTGAGGTVGQLSLAERFQRLDADRDGFIVWTEAAPQRRAEFAAMDKSGDARVSPEEFRDRAAPFAAVDGNRDGALSEEEYLGHHQSMFQRFDADGDKRINSAEFTAAQEAARQK